MYTTLGKHQMLLALKGTNPTTPITHVGLFDKDAAISTITGVASTDVCTKTAHGLSDGNLVVLSAISGGTGLKAGYPYFIITSAANTFQLSETPGGSAHDFTMDVTAMTLERLVEISGGSPAYARKAIAFNAPVEGLMDDSTNGAVVDVPASTVDYVGLFSAVTAGTLLAIDDVTAELFAAQGTYSVTDAKLNLNQDV